MRKLVEDMHKLVEAGVLVAALAAVLQWTDFEPPMHFPSVAKYILAITVVDEFGLVCSPWGRPVAFTVLIAAAQSWPERHVLLIFFACGKVAHLLSEPKTHRVAVNGTTAFLLLSVMPTNLVAGVWTSVDAIAFYILALDLVTVRAISGAAAVFLHIGLVAINDRSDESFCAMFLFSLLWQVTKDAYGLFRPAAPANKNKSRVVSIDGCIGVGKTHACRKLEEKVKVEFETIPESLLELFYGNMKAHALTLQLFTLQRRLCELKVIADEPPQDRLLDRSLLGDEVFAAMHMLGGNINEQERAVYFEVCPFGDLPLLLQKLHKIVYLASPVDNCKRNVVTRDGVDKAIDPEYLEDLDTLHCCLVWWLLITHPELPISIVDWSSFGSLSHRFLFEQQQQPPHRRGELFFHRAGRNSAAVEAPLDEKKDDDDETVNGAIRAFHDLATTVEPNLPDLLVVPKTADEAIALIDKIQEEVVVVSLDDNLVPLKANRLPLLHSQLRFVPHQGFKTLVNCALARGKRVHFEIGARTCPMTFFQLLACAYPSVSASISK